MQKEIKEKAVKFKIKTILKAYGVHYFMPVQTGFGAPHLDFICCKFGRFFAIEAKRPGKVPTPRQELTIKDVVSAGGDALVIDGTNYNVLESYLNTLTATANNGKHQTQETGSTLRG